MVMSETAEEAEESAQEGRVTGTWICMGVRVGGGGKHAVAWQLPGGERVRFIDRASYITGGEYEVTFKDEAGAVTRYGKPRYVRRWTGDADLVRQWRAEEVAAETALARQARQRKDAKTDPLDELLDPLVELAKKLRVGPDRDAFLAHVIRRIQRSAW